MSLRVPIKFTVELAEFAVNNRQLPGRGHENSGASSVGLMSSVRSSASHVPVLYMRARATYGRAWVRPRLHCVRGIRITGTQIVLTELNDYSDSID